MHKFKIGDKVKCIYRFGLQSTKIDSIYTVKNYRLNGNVIFKELPAYAYDPEHFELVDEPKIKQTELKIDGLRTHTIIVDEILDKENLMIKKEGNEMIESMNLIDLYANKHRESIEKEVTEKVEELRKHFDIIDKYNELVKEFEKASNELYLSQFTEEEQKEILLNGDVIDDEDMQLRKIGDEYYANKNFKTDEYFDVMNARNKEISKIDDLVKTVKAHVGIAKTKEEVEEILTRYGIIDKKGKLVTE